MTVATNAELRYGVIFDEDFGFPWEDIDGDGDTPEEVWWRLVTGYTCDGEPDFERERAWMEEHPMPFQAVNYCSDGYPMWIIALPNFGYLAHRGHPHRISALSIPHSSDLHRFRSFLSEHLDCIEEPRWILSSYWGA